MKNQFVKSIRIRDQFFVRKNAVKDAMFLFPKAGKRKKLCVQVFVICFECSIINSGYDITGAQPVTVSPPSLQIPD